MFLSENELDRLVAFRHDLHTHPELSGEEKETAERVFAFLTTTSPDRIVTGLGGYGLAAIYEGAKPGPTILVRCELDALPITEKTGRTYSSAHPGKAHLCGHDGHMTILCALALELGRNRPDHGRAILLFQPAEEDGSGAAAVIADEKFAEIRPDMAFSLHNLPGLPLGGVALKTGPVACASRGLKLHFSGKTAHASTPDTGVSPMPAMAELMPALTALSKGRQTEADFRLVTITHAKLGEPAFGIAPGDGEVWATLRTQTDDGMTSLCQEAEKMAADCAATHGLSLSESYHDIFLHSENTPEAFDVLARAANAQGIPWNPGTLPMRASEDFGSFRKVCPVAMYFLGSGESHPSLHNPDYDFPDELIPIGAGIFLAALRELLGTA